MLSRLAVFAAVLVMSTAASAGPKPSNSTDDKVAPASGHPAPVADPRPGRGGLPTLPGGVQTAGQGVQPGGHGPRGPRGDGPRGNGHRGDGPRHHDGHGWGGPFYPYPPVPMTWPYPAYPWSQYYYPYPPQYYPGITNDDDDTSTRGLVVPGDLPMGIVAFWYYCDTPDGYYPYVKECSHEWTRIPIAPPPPGTAAPLSFSDWQWCEEKKAFFPYVTACPAGFVPVPVTAPGKDQAGPPQTANWYFCEQPRGYSPYVVQCARDWRAVPAVPPPSVKITVKEEGKR
jgi:hypothetical protein